MSITPYLYYEDVDRALRFLKNAFGFRQVGVAMKAADGRINHAAVKCGTGLIMMGRPPKGYRNPKRLGQTTQCLYIDAKQVDRHFARAREAGARVLEEPKNADYGHRRYGVTDPEGHEWYFAEPIRKTPRAHKKAKARTR